MKKIYPQGEIASAKEQFYPNVNLTAFAGFSTLSLDRLLEAGSRIVKGKGCTEFGIASIVSQIIMSILHNERAVIPLSAHLEGEYGESGISAGTPCIVGSNGIDAVLEIDLSYDERRAMRNSCSIILLTRVLMMSVSLRVLSSLHCSGFCCPILPTS